MTSFPQYLTSCVSEASLVMSMNQGLLSHGRSAFHMRQGRQPSLVINVEYPGGSRDTGAQIIRQSGRVTVNSSKMGQ